MAKSKVVGGSVNTTLGVNLMWWKKPEPLVETKKTDRPKSVSQRYKHFQGKLHSGHWTLQALKLEIWTNWKHRAFRFKKRLQYAHFQVCLCNASTSM